MAMKVGSPLDFAGNQIINLRPEHLASLPTASMTGRLVYNSSDQSLNMDTGTSWKTFSTIVSFSWGDITGKPSVFATNLANISDMSAFVRTLADDADATTFRATLGLGSAALSSTSAFATASHSHGDADITALSATKLTGTIDPARLPVMPSSVQIVSSGGIAALTAPQQADIGDGSIVTTTDGRRWIYSGSGSKTLEASYIELADVTPEWSVIANKPSSFTPSTHSHTISDVTNLQTTLDARTRKAASTGPGSTASTWAFTHNLNTTDVVVSLYEIATNTMVLCETVTTNANTVTFNFGAAQTLNTLRAVVIG